MIEPAAQESLHNARKLKIWQAFLVALALKIALSYFFHFVAETLGIENVGATANDFSIFETIMAVVIIAPIVETTLIQFGLQELVIYFFRGRRNKFIYAILISSLVFSSMHYDNLLHVTASFLGGLIYSSFYMLIRIKDQKRASAVILTSMVHVLYNLSEFLSYGSY